MIEIENSLKRIYRKAKKSVSHFAQEIDYWFIFKEKKKQMELYWGFTICKKISEE